MCERIHESMLSCIHLWVPIKTLTHLHSGPAPTSDPQAFDNTTEISNRRTANKSKVCPPIDGVIHSFSHTQKKTFLTESPERKVTSRTIQFTGESNHFQTNKYLPVQPVNILRNLLLQTHIHRHTHTYVHHTLDAVIHTPSELNQRFHLEGKHRALLLHPITGARKRSQQPQFYTITLSRRKSAPCLPLLRAENCQPGLEQKPLKLSYSRNDLSSLWERILYNLVKASSTSVFFSCITLAAIKQIP